MMKPSTTNPLLALGLLVATVYLTSFAQSAGADAYHNAKQKLANRRQGAK